MNKSNFLIIGLFSILLYFPITAMAENSSVTDHGFVGMDSTIYIVKENKSTLAKVSGIGDVPQGVDQEDEWGTVFVTGKEDYGRCGVGGGKGVDIGWLGSVGGTAQEVQPEDNGKDV